MSQEQVDFVVDRGAGEDTDVGVTVDVNFLDVVAELEAVERCFVLQVRIPVRLRKLRKPRNVGGVVIANEMRLAVEDELAGELGRTLVGGAGG